MTTWTFDTLTRASLSELEGLMRRGVAPALDSIVGWEFRGWNVLPAYGVPLFWAMSNLRFIKAFVERDGRIAGYNLKVCRGGRHTPWFCTPSDKSRTLLGFYDVFEPGVGAKGVEYPRALFLDYAQPENTLFTGRTLEDYVVQVMPENPDLLLGKAYLPLGKVRFGGFFVLQRLRQARD